MGSRRRPETVSARVTQAEKAVVVAAASMAGLPVSEWVHCQVVPAAVETLVQTVHDEQAAHVPTVPSNTVTTEQAR